jgi:hypothetical protein
MKHPRLGALALGTVALGLGAVGCNLHVSGNVFSNAGPEGGAPGVATAAPGAEGTQPGAAAAATGASAGTRHVRLEPGFGPNPTIVDDLSIEATVNPSKLQYKYDCGFGQNVSSEPNVVLELPKGMPGKLQVRVRNAVWGLLVSQGEKFWCAEASTIEGVTTNLADLPAGSYELRVIEQSSGKREARIELSDPSRGQLYDASVKRETLAAAPPKPLFVLGKTRAGVARHKVQDSFADCKGLYADMPDAIYEAGRPLGKITIRQLWTPLRAEMRVQQLAAQEREQGVGHCPKDGESELRNFEGRVALFFGTPKKDHPEIPFGYVILGEKTEIDPLTLSPIVPLELDFDQRSIFNHFPLLDPKDLQERTFRGDQNRQGLFLQAPKSLFVAPKYDLDDNSLRSKGAAAPLPKKGEALLVWSQGGDFVTAWAPDGARYEVKKSTLEPAKGKLAVLADVHHEELKLGDAIAAAAPADKPIVDKLDAKQKAYDKCYDGRMEPVRNQLDAMERGGWFPGKEGRMRAIGDQASDAAERGCGLGAFGKAQEQTAKELSAERSKRRKAMLERIRARLGGL